MRVALLMLLLAGVPAAAQNGGDQLCEAVTGSGGCLDWGSRDGYRPAPRPDPADRGLTAEQRAERWRQLQESIQNMEHPRQEPSLPEDASSLAAEDVEAENKVLLADSRSFALAFAGTALAETIETALLVEIFVGAAPYVLVAGAVYTAYEGCKWFISKARDAPRDALDPNGAKAPGKPGAAEDFKEPKGKPWARAKNGDWGWVAANGDIWVPTGPDGGPGSVAHGDKHWDVQHRGGGHTNVYPGGRRR